MVKYDLMLAEWASGSITNRFPIEFWVYKVVSQKNGHIAVMSVTSVTSVTKSVTIGYKSVTSGRGNFAAVVYIPKI